MTNPALLNALAHDAIKYRDPNVQSDLKWFKIILGPFCCTRNCTFLDFLLDFILILWKQANLIKLIWNCWPEWLNQNVEHISSLLIKSIKTRSLYGFLLIARFLYWCSKTAASSIRHYTWRHHFFKTSFDHFGFYSAWERRFVILQCFSDYDNFIFSDQVV